jgi:replicative DNA helicase
MEKKILYDLIFLCQDLDEQTKKINKIKELPETVFDDPTRRLLKTIYKINEIPKLATAKTITTYSKFNQSTIDIDDYFWELDPLETKELDLDEAFKFFIKEKEKEINELRIQQGLELYKKTGDINTLKNLDFIRTSDDNKIIKIHDAIESGLKRLEDIKDKKDVDRIKLSNQFFFIQMITKGFEAGELILIAARPGVGKTALSLALLNDVSKQKKKTLFFSLEMSKEELIERMLIAKTGITRSVFFSQSNFTNEKFKELEEAGKELEKQTIKIVDEPPQHFIEMKEMIKREHKENGLDIVIIDYLSLIGAYNSEDKGMDTRLTISKISRDAKLLAKELHIPIILLQQVNRNAAAGARGDTSFKELQLTDLRDSGSLEQDANKVFLLWNQEAKTEDDKKAILDSKYKVILNIAKNRNGQANQKILLEFNMPLQRIKEIDWITKPSTWVDNK